MTNFKIKEIKDQLIKAREGKQSQIFDTSVAGADNNTKIAKKLNFRKFVIGAM